MNALVNQLNTLRNSARETLWPVTVLITVFAVCFAVDPKGLDLLEHPLFVGTVAMIIATIFVIFDLKDSVEASAVDQTLYLAAETANEAGPTIIDYKEAFSAYNDLIIVVKRGLQEQESWVRRGLSICPVVPAEQLRRAE